MRKSFYDHCKEQGRMDLLAEWHATKNGGLMPGDVTAGSHISIWWQCAKGHEWQAIVKSRVYGAGCPYCANRVLVPGKNDLATLYPEIAQHWLAEKNGSLKPVDVMPGTNKRVWWICEKGHEWQTSVVSRTGGTGCPVCASKRIIPGENDMASLFPAVAAQWLADRNGALTPETVSPYSNRKVWWRCERAHVYQMTVASRTMKGSGCPYCAGKKVFPGFNDLATTEPRLAAQWHPALNGALTPQTVTAGSHKKVWWQCPEGHVWNAVVYSRAGPQKSGCPVCARQVNQARQNRYRTVCAEHGQTVAKAAFAIQTTENRRDYL